MIAGAVTIFLWKFLVRPLGGAWDIYELLPAFIVGIVMTILVSLLTKAPDQTVIAEFDAAAKMARGD
jgi:sodium/proline symporter